MKGKKQDSKFKDQDGFLMVGVLMIMVFFITITTAIYEYSINSFISSRRSVMVFDALSLAEAGADAFMYNINADANYTGTGAVTLYDDAIKGKGTYETTVANGTITNEKIVTATGKIYFPSTSATPNVTRKVKLVIQGANPNPYSVQMGPGGLILKNGSSINNGEIYVNGYITISNNSTIGSSSTPLNVFIADYQCPSANPPGSTFPALCGANPPPPVTFGNNGSHIYGTVKINNGGSDSHMTNPGYTTGTVNPTTLPDPGRSTIKSTINSTMTAANASSCNSPYKTWTNVHITGNVSLPNSCTITIAGNVWIDGNLVTGNNNIFNVDNALSTAPQIMIDGSTGFDGGNGVDLVSNSSGVALSIVTYWNSDGDPDATTLSGNDLYNSIYLSNNRSNPKFTIKTGGHTNASSGSTLYARWSGIDVQNSGSVGTIIGQIIQLSNGGSVTFNGTPNISTPTTWDVRYYEPTY